LLKFFSFERKGDFIGSGQVREVLSFLTIFGSLSEKEREKWKIKKAIILKKYFGDFF